MLNRLDLFIKNKQRNWKLYNITALMVVIQVFIGFMAILIAMALVRITVIFILEWSTNTEKMLSNFLGTAIMFLSILVAFVYFAYSSIQVFRKKPDFYFSYKEATELMVFFNKVEESDYLDEELLILKKQMSEYIEKYNY